MLDGIDLAVPEGTVSALLGPNGAGKTTTIQILSTLIGADDGEVRVAGYDVAQDPDAAVIGVTGQFSAVDNMLTGEENLHLMADLRHLDRRAGRRRASELLDHGRLVAEGSPDELKRRIPGGHIRLEFASADGLDAAARTLGAPTRDDDALTLQVPSDGSVESPRALLDRLDGQSIEVGGLSIHTPDLDDVFLTLTGQPDNDKEKEPAA